MFFFFFFNKDFRYELENFRSNPKLDAECRRAKKQLAEFRNRFPLDRLRGLSPDECFSISRGHKNDYYSWIFDKTKDVAGAVARAKNMPSTRKVQANSAPAYFREDLEYERKADQHHFTTAVHDCLVYFLKSQGRECLFEAERAFGEPQLLKLLNLYYPDEYVGIAKVGWIDRIVDSFSLDEGITVYDRSLTVKQFFDEQESDCRQGERLESPAIRAFFDDYFGFSSYGKKFVAYLKSIEGLSDELAEKFARHARSFSRLLQGHGLLKVPLFKSTGADVRTQGKAFLLEYANKLGLSNGRKEDFERVIDVYSSYYDKASRDEQLYVYRVPPTYSLAGRPRVRQEGLTQANRDNWASKKKGVDWKDKFAAAKSSLEVANILEAAATERLYFRHYTTLSSFMYITEQPNKWMFRLTRGDDPSMNDQLECRRLGDAETWKRTFIGSFSCVEDESAAMWGLYGKPTNEALRLSFSRDAMQQWLDVLFNQKGLGPEVQFFSSNGNPAEKVQLRWDDIEFHFADVLYGGNVGQDESSGGSYIFRKRQLKKSLFADFNPKFEKTPEITGFIKSIDWAYEEEARIIARVGENATLPTGKATSEIQYVFIPIPTEVLAMVEYMKGPCVPEKLGPVLSEQITHIIGPKALISDSKYNGNLKFK